MDNKTEAQMNNQIKNQIDNQVGGRMKNIQMKDIIRNDPFSKILRNEIPCKKVHETDITLIFHDINPSASTHCIAITKNFYKSYEDFLNRASDAEIVTFWKDIAHCSANLLNLKNGYRVVSNSGLGGQQEVPYIHVHIMSFV